MESKVNAAAMGNTSFLNGMDRESLLSRIGQAECTIEEEIRVIAGCRLRLDDGAAAS